jgi:hypothetical protein
MGEGSGGEVGQGGGWQGGGCSCMHLPPSSCRGTQVYQGPTSTSESIRATPPTTAPPHTPTATLPSSTTAFAANVVEPSSAAGRPGLLSLVVSLGSLLDRNAGAEAGISGVGAEVAGQGGCTDYRGNEHGWCSS